MKILGIEQKFKEMREIFGDIMKFKKWRKLPEMDATVKVVEINEMV